MACCFLIMLGSFCAAMVVLCLKRCRVPSASISTPLTSLHGSSGAGSHFVPPPVPLAERSESAGPAPRTDGRPVGLYLSRTDAALAAARRLSLLTALSVSALQSRHPAGMRFPAIPTASSGRPTNRSDTSDLEFQRRQPAFVLGGFRQKRPCWLDMCLQQSCFLVRASMSLWRAPGGAK